MLEKVLESRIVKKAKELGFLAYKFASPSNRGVSDRIFISPKGSILFVEFKSKKGKLTALQTKFQLELQTKGITTFIIRDIDMGIELLANEL